VSFIIVNELGSPFSSGQLAHPASHVAALPHPAETKPPHTNGASKSNHGFKRF
jgi:hypothetical protein